MNAPDIIANISHGWNRSAAEQVLGTTYTGVSAALWTHLIDDVQEVWADPDPNLHTVYMPLVPVFADVRKDGRHVFAKVVPPGAFSVMEAGVRPHAIHRGPWSVLHIYIPSLLVASVAELAGCPSPDRCLEFIDSQCTHDDVIEKLGRDVLVEMRQGDVLSQLRVDSIGQDLAVRLLRKHSNYSKSGLFSRADARGGLAPWQIKRACDKMMASLDDETALPGLAILAALVDLSPNHFCNAFHESMGMPPHRWLTHARITRARMLLADQSLSLAEIALRVGYGSHTAFTTAFKRLTGVTPSEFRRQI